MPRPGQHHTDTSPSMLQRASAEMDRLLQAFQAWESPVRGNLLAHGFWTDSVDPRRGRAMHGQQGEQYSEAIAAQVFLGYPVNDAGLCSIVVHPRHGHETYPVSLFTSAPLAQLQSALVQACGLQSTGAWLGGPSGGPKEGPVLAVRAALVHVADDGPRCAARALSFELCRGQRMLVTGPPGAGKSSLLMAIQGLLPLRKGEIEWTRGVRVCCAPQEPVRSPGGTLLSELTYPDACDDGHDGSLSEAEAADLLTRVGLRHLLDGGSVRECLARHWSRGEMQCLAIARLLRQRPDVVLLDEALGAVPLEIELKLLQQLFAIGVTVIMVSHRADVASLANAVLTINPAVSDGWHLSER
jgi:ABC-type Mn2+/Zn2+ transport system ATPase subunit